MIHLPTATRSPGSPVAATPLTSFVLGPLFDEMMKRSGVDAAKRAVGILRPVLQKRSEHELGEVDDADAPSTRDIQYFEMMGQRGIYEDGWKAVTRRNPLTGEEDPWELYFLPDDFSECNDLADAEPEKLAHLQELWWRELERHGGLPYDTRTLELFNTPRRPHTPHQSREYRYLPPVSHLPAEVAPAIGGRSWTMTATVMRAQGEDGVLFTTGTQNSGYAFFVKDDHLCFDYNSFGDHTLVRSEVPIPAAAKELSVRFERSGRTGSAEVSIDGNACGREDIPWVMRMMSSVGADIGRSHNSPVSPEYAAPFRFAGTLHELVVSVDPSRSEREREEQARARFAAEMSTQ